MAPLSYRECLTYLERLGNEVLAMKFGLKRTRRLLEALGRPQERYGTVLVAGTNGKGSVCRMLSSVLSASGCKTGLFTSPHLLHVSERIAVNGAPLSSERFACIFNAALDGIAKTAEMGHPTYFELMTVLALKAFAEEAVEIAVLEVGMGGRLDSTNVVDPLLSIVTPVGMDHQRFLGSTLSEIAREKAGVARPGRPLLSAPQSPEAARVLRRECRRKGASFSALNVEEIEWKGSCEGAYRFGFRGGVFQLRGLGAHQVENAALSILAVEQLRRMGIEISADALKRGLERALPLGAVERVSTDPDVFRDGAHNLEATRRLCDFLREHSRSPRSLVFGMMRDKPVQAVLSELRPLFKKIYLTSTDSPRAAAVEELKALCPEGVPVPSPRRALERALADGLPTVVVAGSLYLIGVTDELFPRPSP